MVDVKSTLLLKIVLSIQTQTAHVCAPFVFLGFFRTLYLLGLVKITGPSLVIATVCSKWALQDSSSV